MSNKQPKLKKYIVTFDVIERGEEEVEAENKADAIEIVEGMYWEDTANFDAYEIEDEDATPV